MKIIGKKTLLVAMAATLLIGSADLLAGCGCGKPKPPVRPLVKEVVASALALDQVLNQQDDVDCQDCDDLEEGQTRCFDICANAVQRAAVQAKKCCKNLKNQVDDIEDLLEDQLAANQQCCSLVDVIETLAVSQSDQIAVCCAETSVVLGSVDTTCSVVDVSAIDATEISALQWAKSIYCLIQGISECLNCPLD